MNFTNRPVIARLFLLIVSTVIVLLDWAALDDITTNQQTDYTGEYAMLASSALLLPLLIYVWIKLNQSSSLKTHRSQTAQST